MKTNKEYQVINLMAEYAGRIAEFKYAVASKLSEEELQERCGAELKKYEPYLYLTYEQGQAIMESIANNDKHRMRRIRSCDYFGYEDGETEMRHNSDLLIRTDEWDPLLRIIRQEEEEEQRRKALEYDRLLAEALKTLTEIQRRRLEMYFFDEMSESEIAALEHIEHQVCSRCIARALKKLRKYFEENS